MKARIKQQLRNSKRRLQRRLRQRKWRDQRRALLRRQNVHYELAEKTQGLNCAGLGAFQLLSQRLRLAEALDAHLHLLKRHVPYFESDHILNLTYHFLVGGKNLQDLERLRTNENYLDALGVPRIPDPTTAGDFLRRFDVADVDTLMDVINRKRLLVWQQQPAAFFEQAIIDGDGTVVETGGGCKQGLDLSYNGKWGYHPLLISLANTQEPLFILNRSGNRPSHEGAAAYFDRAVTLCRQAGFRKIVLRGDTDFTQAAHLDRWDDAGVGFVFGMDAQPNVVALTQALPERVWQTLQRPVRQPVGPSRQRPVNVKEAVVRRRGYRNLRLVGEQVAEFNYQPGPCAREYLLVVLRKELVWERHGVVEGRETRYLFYLTNQATWACADVVLFANDRGNQENLIEQLKNGVPALRAASNTLVANGAYMVIGALAWSMKVWLGLLQPAKQGGSLLVRMEFKAFVQALMQLPCQVLRSGRRLIYRLLAYSPWVERLCLVSERLRKRRWD